MNLKKTVIGAIVAASVVASVSPAVAAQERVDGSADLYKALERDLGWSRAQVEANGKVQLAAGKLDQAVQKQLGTAYAGSYFDAKSGALVVNSTTDQGVAAATKLGAQGRLVKFSLRELGDIKAKLDDAAGVVPTSDRKQASGVSKFDVSAWSVDPVTNSVRISATTKQLETATSFAANFGDRVSVEELPAAPEAANWMDGGDAINGGSCSAGFNLRNPSTGTGYLLTAGHCVSAGSTLTGQGGVAFGRVLESWFPSFDDAIIRNDNPGAWTQGPWVDTNPSNGGFVTTTGFTDGPVGTVICKSGITTKWTCGAITAKNQTVTYSGGRTVWGLTRHNACVEPGDSGGANVSVAGATRAAEGVTSGASMVDWDGRKRCIGAIWGWLGFQNVSWYFPIANSLSYYGPKYGVSTW